MLHWLLAARAGGSRRRASCACSLQFQILLLADFALLRALLDPDVLRRLSGGGACAARAPALPQRGRYQGRKQSLAYRLLGERVRTPHPLPPTARSSAELRHQRSALRCPYLLRMTGHPAHSKHGPRDWCLRPLALPRTRPTGRELEKGATHLYGFSHRSVPAAHCS